MFSTAFSCVRHLKKGKRAERAHQYRVIANRLGFHLERRHFVSEREIVKAVESARDSLLRAADLLERADQREELGVVIERRLTAVLSLILSRRLDSFVHFQTGQQFAIAWHSASFQQLLVM